jgi:hypothetical protein
VGVSAGGTAAVGEGLSVCVGGSVEVLVEDAIGFSATALDAQPDKIRKIQTQKKRVI